MSVFKNCFLRLAGKSPVGSGYSGPDPGGSGSGSGGNNNGGGGGPGGGDDDPCFFFVCPTQNPTGNMTCTTVTRTKGDFGLTNDDACPLSAGCAHIVDPVNGSKIFSNQADCESCSCTGPPPDDTCEGYICTSDCQQSPPPGCCEAVTFPLNTVVGQNVTSCNQLVYPLQSTVYPGENIYSNEIVCRDTEHCFTPVTPCNDPVPVKCPGPGAGGGGCDPVPGVVADYLDNGCPGVGQFSTVIETFIDGIGNIINIGEILFGSQADCQNTPFCQADPNIIYPIPSAGKICLCNTAGDPVLLDPSLYLLPTLGSVATIDVLNWGLAGAGVSEPSFNPVTGRITFPQSLGLTNPVATSFKSTSFSFRIQVNDGDELFYFPSQFGSFNYNINLCHTISDSTDACCSNISCKYPTGGGGGPIQTGGKTQAGGPTIYASPENESIARSRDYDNSITDSIFEKSVSNRNYSRTYKFIPVNRGDLPSNIFADTVHSSIRSVFRINQEQQPFSDNPYSDIPLAAIEDSLNEDLKLAIWKAYDIDGRSLRTKILERIREALITNRLYRISAQNIKQLANSCVSNEYKANDRVTTTNEQKAIELLIDKSLPLDPNRYGGVSQERMRLWKTLATDVNKHIPVIDGNGNTAKLYINDDDSFIFVNNNNEEDLLYINDANIVEGSNIKVSSDIDKAYVPNFRELTQAFRLLGDTYNIQIDISTPVDETTEEKYGKVNARESMYIMRLRPDTVEDEDRTHPLIRRTFAQYRLLTDDEDINEWVKYKPWPYLAIYLDNEDPFFNYLVTKRNFDVRFKDICTKIFVGFEDSIPIIPRRIPWHIAVIPTDKDELLVQSGRSISVDYNTRRLYVSMNPMPEEYSQRWDHIYLNQEFTDEPLDPDLYTSDALQFAKSSTKVTPQKTFKRQAEDLPRKSFAGRALLQKLKELQDNGDSYVDSAGTTVTWATVYESLSPAEKKALSLTEFTDWTKFKSKLFRGEVSGDPDVDSRYPKVSEVPNLKSNKGGGSFTSTDSSYISENIEDLGQLGL